MTVRKIGETAVHSPLKRVSLLVLAILFFVSATAFATPSVIYDVTIYDGDTVVSVSTVSATVARLRTFRLSSSPFFFFPLFTDE